MTCIVGLTGGLASGKSTVAKFIRLKKFPVVDADYVAHQITKPKTPVWRKLHKTFGPALFYKDGRLKRHKMAELIFSNPDKRSLLNKITHYEIIKNIRSLIKKHKRAKAHVIFVEAALFIEKGFHKKIRPVIVVWVDKETQITRIIERDRVTRKDALLRTRSQMPLSRKKILADYVIDNSGSRRRTKKQLEEVLSSLLSRYL